MEIEITKQLPGVAPSECMPGGVYQAVSREGTDMGIYLCAKLDRDHKLFLVSLSDGHMAPVEAWPTTRFNPCDAVARIQL